LSSSWSLDNKYIVAGSEDDIVSIFSFTNKCIIARGVSGHEGNVSRVIIDSFQSNETTLRIISVGEDGIMSFWEIENIQELQEETNSKLETSPLLVPCLPKNLVVSFEPFVTRRIHQFPIGDVVATENYVITVCCDNVVRFWLRPNQKSMKKEEKKK
jgi:WD40 repeat protein